MSVAVDWDDGTVNHTASREWNQGEKVPEVKITDGKVSEGRRVRIEDKMSRVEECVARMMVQLDPTGARSSTDKTPYRVARMFLTELTSGYYVNIEELFEAVFPNEGSDGMVVVKDIPVYSLCEHHWMPMYGKAHVGYMPDGRVLGLSKAARVVEAYARRFQLQERLTRQVMEAMDKHLQPLGTMVVVEAEHLCLAIRGAQKPGTVTVTNSYSGVFEENRHLVQEFFDTLNRS